jgi:hypothetical protein
LDAELGPEAEDTALAEAGDPQPLAESTLALARALWETGGDRARARRLAEEAQPALAGGQLDADLDATAWLATHAP